MSNYSSPLEQCQTETRRFFYKILDQKTVQKSEIIQLYRHFKRLKEVAPGIYKDMTRDANTLMNNATELIHQQNGQDSAIETKKWEKLNELYVSFSLSLIPSIKAKPKSKKAISIKKEIDAMFVAIFDMSMVPKEMLLSLAEKFMILIREYPDAAEVGQELNRVLYPENGKNPNRTEIPIEELDHIYEAFLFL